MQRWLETFFCNCSKHGSTIPLTERAQFILLQMRNTPLLLNYRIYGHIGKFVTVLIIILTIVFNRFGCIFSENLNNFPKCVRVKMLGSVSMNRP